MNTCSWGCGCVVILTHAPDRRSTSGMGAFLRTLKFGTSACMLLRVWMCSGMEGRMTERTTACRTSGSSTLRYDPVCCDDDVEAFLGWRAHSFPGVIVAHDHPHYNPDIAIWRGSDYKKHCFSWIFLLKCLFCGRPTPRLRLTDPTTVGIQRLVYLTENIALQAYPFHGVFVADDSTDYVFLHDPEELALLVKKNEDPAIRDRNHNRSFHRGVFLFCILFDSFTLFSVFFFALSLCPLYSDSFFHLVLCILFLSCIESTTTIES